jgi:Pentapeptide repeats (8 copies)
VKSKPQRSWWRHPPLWLRIAIIVVALVAFVLVWVLIPPLLYRNVAGSDEARLKAITDTRTALLAGLVGIGALGTFWLNSRVYQITARTFQVTERGQVTDRYSKAIEQLGSATVDVRLGGIYALGQIAKDSDRGEEDQTTIVEVLSAFVRVHSDPLFQHKASLGDQASSEPAEERHRKAAQYVDELGGLPVDVQAAVTVLARLPTRNTRPYLADFTKAWLRKANLSLAKLTKANLYGANLSGTDLLLADLSGASLIGATLTAALLNNANLTEANFYGADLTEANFYGADLSGANLTETSGLTQEQVDDADGDESTLLPTGLHPPERWHRAEAPTA